MKINLSPTKLKVNQPRKTQYLNETPESRRRSIERKRDYKAKKTLYQKRNKLYRERNKAKLKQRREWLENAPKKPPKIRVIGQTEDQMKLEALDVNAPRKKRYKATPESIALKKKRALEYKKNAAKSRKDSKAYYKKNKLKIAQRRKKLQSLPAQKLSVKSYTVTLGTIQKLGVK